ncbi:VanZ family protein [Streptomyces sp. NPDC002405]
MIEASIGALANLIPVFVVASILVAVPVYLLARAKRKPAVATTLWSISLVGVLAVTLTPGGAGAAESGIVCYVGPSLAGTLSTTPGKLNVLLFVPVCFFGVCAFRRPFGVLAGGLLLTAGVELLQSLLPLGRSCVYSDLAANALGSGIGVLCAVSWQALKRQKPLFGLRDVRQGGLALGVGGVALAAIFYFGVTPVYGGQESVGATGAQEEWARSVVDQVYGKGTNIVQVQQREAIPGFPGKVDVTTDKGSMTLLWPDRKIQSAFSVNNKDDAGTLTPEESKKSAEEFAKKWYADEVKGSEATFDPLAKGKAPYVLSYRRYRNGVMLPLRLDITVTSSGRIMGVNAQLVDDPEMPEPRLDEAAAKKRAEQLTKLKAGDPAFMIAQEVLGDWRPVWIVNLIREGETEPKGAAIYLDAVSGEPVQRQE